MTSLKSYWNSLGPAFSGCYCFKYSYETSLPTRSFDELKIASKSGYPWLSGTRGTSYSLWISPSLTSSITTWSDEIFSIISPTSICREIYSSNSNLLMIFSHRTWLIYSRKLCSYEISIKCLLRLSLSNRVQMIGFTLTIILPSYCPRSCPSIFL